MFRDKDAADRFGVDNGNADMMKLFQAILRNQYMNDEIEALQAKIDQKSTLAATTLVAKAPIVIPILETPRAYAPADQISLSSIIRNNTGIIINSLTVQEKIELRTRASTRASSQAADSTHVASRLTVTTPAIGTPILTRPQPYLTIPNIECSSTPMELILSVTNITVLGSPQSFAAMIYIPVRSTVMYNDFSDQQANSTHKPEQQCSIFNSSNSNCTSTQVPSDNFRRIDIDVSYESEQVDPTNFNNQCVLSHGSQYTGKTRDEATLYSDWKKVQASMTIS